MTTDKDIIAALHGQPSAADRETTAAIAETYGRTRTSTAREGELPLQKRGDVSETLAIWVAKEAAETATATLAEALMRANAKLGIYEAESAAKGMAAEAYTEAAKRSPYEIERHESVARFVTKMAAICGRKTAEATKRPNAATVTKPTRQESARRSPVRITEIARPGRVTIIK